jgi:hypothetical protein
MLFFNHNIYTGIVPVLGRSCEIIQKSLNLSASKLLLAAISGPATTGLVCILYIQEKQT